VEEHGYRRLTERMHFRRIRIQTRPTIDRFRLKMRLTNTSESRLQTA
jgi:hypothetical protein